MELRPLGPTDLRVTPVIFGAWAIGGWMWGGADDLDAIAAIRASLDSGVNTIDTAPAYGQGHSEELVGQAINGLQRDKVVLATKCGRRWNSDHGSDAMASKDEVGNPITMRSDSRPESIFQECEQSLKRLGTDYIDLYQIHWPDKTRPISEAIGAMVKLREQGKIRAVGVSNFDAAMLAEAKAADPMLASLQPPFSLIQRQIENDLLPYCRENQIGAIVYSPMERGLLTGKVSPDRKFNEGDHRASHKFFTRENRQRVLDSLAKIKPIADRHGVGFPQLVINWTFSQPGVTAALVGARNAEQAADNARAMSFKLSPDELTQIRAAFDETSVAMTGQAVGAGPTGWKS